MAWIKRIGWWALRVFIGLNILLLLLAGAFFYDENRAFQLQWMTRIHYALNEVALNELAQTFLQEEEIWALHNRSNWLPPVIQLEDKNRLLLEANAELSERLITILNRFWPKHWAPNSIIRTNNGQALIFMQSNNVQGRRISFAMLYWPDRVHVTLPCKNADLADETGECDIRLAANWTMNYTWHPAYRR